MPKRWSEVTPYTTDFNPTDLLHKSTDTGIGSYQSQTFLEQSFEDYLGSGLLKPYQASGVLTGGDIAPNGLNPSTQYDMTAGTGRIYDTTTGTIKSLIWPDFIGNIPTFLLSNFYTFVFIRESAAPGIGEIYETNVPPTPLERRTYIPVGTITHPVGLGIQSASNTKRVALDQLGHFTVDNASEPFITMTREFQFNYAFNPGTGLPLGNLQLSLIPLNTDVGSAVRMRGGGSGSDPNHLTLPTVPAFPSLFTAYRDASEQPVPGVSLTGEIDPTKYNPVGGGLLDVEDSRQWSVLRMYIFPGATAPALLWGRATYPTKLNALQNFKQEFFNVAPLRRSFLELAIFVSYIIVSKNTTDLSDPEQAVFIPVVEEYGASVIDNVNSGLISGGVVTDEGGLSVSWTSLSVYDIVAGEPKEASGGITTVSDNTINFIYWKQTTQSVTIDTIGPTSVDVLLSIVPTAVGDIVELWNSLTQTKRLRARLDVVAQNEPVSVTDGMLIEPDPDITSNLDVRMTAGEYISGGVIFHPVSAVNSRTIIDPGPPIVYSMSRYYHASGLWTYDTSPDIDTLYFDNGTDLELIPNNRWAVCIFAYKHDEQNDIDQIAYFYPLEHFANEPDAILFAEKVQAGIVEIPNQPPGFARSPKLMAYVFKWAESALVPPATAPTRWVDLRVSVGTGGGGAAAPFVPAEFTQAYFVRDNGNDGDSGKNWDTAFGTFAAAISAISALSPGSTNQFAIRCADAGNYIENFALPVYTHVDAPNATIEGQLILGEGSSFKCNKHTNNAAGYAVQGATTGTARACYDVTSLEIKDDVAAFHGIGVPAGVTVPIIARFLKIVNNNSSATPSNSVANLNVNSNLLIVNGKEIVNTSSNSRCVYNNASSTLEINVDKIAASDSGATALQATAGTILVACGNCTGQVVASSSAQIIGSLWGRFNGAVLEGGSSVINVRREIFTQTFFVRENGNDNDEGLNWQTAFETFAQANTAVIAQSPSATNQWTIICLDAGNYSENITVPVYTKIYAPNATIEGQVTLNEGACLITKNHVQSAVGYMLKGAATGSATAYYRTTIMQILDDTVGDDRYDGIGCPATATVPLIINFDCMVNSNSSTTHSRSVENLNASDLLSISCSEITNGSINSYNIYNNGAGTIDTKCSKLLAASSSSQAILADDGEILINAGIVVGNVSTTGDAKITGTFWGIFDGNFASSGTSVINVRLAEYTQAYFVRESGNDENNGKNEQNAFATIGAAITAVTGQSPTVSNQFSIVLKDSAIYPENINVPPYTHIGAPTAILYGQIILGSGSSTNFKKQINGATGDAVRGATTGSDTAYYKVDLLEIEEGVSNEVYDGIGCPVTTTVPVIATVNKIINHNVSTSVSKSVSNLNSTNKLIMHVNSIENLSANSYAVYNNGAGQLTITGNSIICSSTTSEGVRADAGTILVSVQDFKGKVTANGATVRGDFSGNFSGYLVQTGTTTGFIDIHLKKLSGIIDITAVTPANIDLNFHNQLAYNSINGILATSNNIAISVTPTSSDGIEFYTLTFTPACIKRPITIKAVGVYGSGNATFIWQALFLDSATDAIRASAAKVNANETTIIETSYTFSPTSSATPITAKIRFGPNEAVTCYSNSSNGSVFLGATQYCHMVISQSGNEI